MPRTMGCTLCRPKNALDTKIKLMEVDKIKQTSFLHPLFEITLEDIFNKFDLLTNKVLGFEEIKGFMSCIGRKFTEGEFEDMLKTF